MEKSYVVMPLAEKTEISPACYISIFASIVWGLVFVNEFFKESTFGVRFGIWLAFVIIYMICHYVKIIAFLPAIADTYLIVGFLWVFCNWIPSPVIKIICKVITAAFVGMLILSQALMATFKC